MSRKDEIIKVLVNLRNKLWEIDGLFEEEIFPKKVDESVHQNYVNSFEFILSNCKDYEHILLSIIQFVIIEFKILQSLNYNELIDITQLTNKMDQLWDVGIAIACLPHPHCMIYIYLLRIIDDNCNLQKNVYNFVGGIHDKYMSKFVQLSIEFIGNKNKYDKQFNIVYPHCKLCNINSITSWHQKTKKSKKNDISKLWKYYQISNNICPEIDSFVDYIIDSETKVKKGYIMQCLVMHAYTKYNLAPHSYTAYISMEKEWHQQIGSCYVPWCIRCQLDKGNIPISRKNIEKYGSKDYIEFISKVDGQAKKKKQLYNVILHIYILI